MKSYITKELMQMFWKSIVLIVILAILGGGAMGFYAKKKQHTTYMAKQELVISHNINDNRNTSNNQDNITNADMNMMNTYSDIAENETISESAYKLLPKSVKKNYTVQKVNDAVSASSQPQSLVLTIKAETDSAKDSVEIAHATGKAMKKDLSSLQPGAGTVKLLAKPTTKSTSSTTTPSVKKYAAVGAAMGGLIGIVISFVVITLKDLTKEKK